MASGSRSSPGVRAEVYGLSGELVVDPRLNIHQQLSRALTLRQAIGRYHQPPTPGDVDPDNGNPDLDSSYVDQVSLGLDARLPHAILASVTGFYNYGDAIGVRIRNPRPGGEAPEPNLGGLGPTFELLLEKQLGFAIYRENLGRARSLGAEVLLKRNVGSWFTMLAYTLSVAERTDDPRTGAGLATVRARPAPQPAARGLEAARGVAVRGAAPGRVGQPVQPVDLERRERAVRSVGRPAADLRQPRRCARIAGGTGAGATSTSTSTSRTRPTGRNVEGREFSFQTERDRDIVGLPIIPFIGVEFLPLI